MEYSCHLNLILRNRFRAFASLTNGCFPPKAGALVPRKSVGPKLDLSTLKRISPSIVIHHLHLPSDHEIVHTCRTGPQSLLITGVWPPKPAMAASHPPPLPQYQSQSSGLFSCSLDISHFCTPRHCFQKASLYRLQRSNRFQPRTQRYGFISPLQPCWSWLAGLLPASPSL